MQDPITYKSPLEQQSNDQGVPYAPGQTPIQEGKQQPNAVEQIPQQQQQGQEQTQAQQPQGIDMVNVAINNPTYYNDNWLKIDKNNLQPLHDASYYKDYYVKKGYNPQNFDSFYSTIKAQYEHIQTRDRTPIINPLGSQAFGYGVHSIEDLYNTVPDTPLNLSDYWNNKTIASTVPTKIHDDADGGILRDVPKSWFDPNSFGSRLWNDVKVLANLFPDVTGANVSDVIPNYSKEGFNAKGHKFVLQYQYDKNGQPILNSQYWLAVKPGTDTPGVEAMTLFDTAEGGGLGKGLLAGLYSVLTWSVHVPALVGFIPKLLDSYRFTKDFTDTMTGLSNKYLGTELQQSGDPVKMQQELNQVAINDYDARQDIINKYGDFMTPYINDFYNNAKAIGETIKPFGLSDQAKAMQGKPGGTFRNVELLLTSAGDLIGMMKLMGYATRIFSGLGIGDAAFKLGSKEFGVASGLGMAYTFVQPEFDAVYEQTGDAKRAANTALALIPGYFFLGGLSGLGIKFLENMEYMPTQQLRAKFMSAVDKQLGNIIDINTDGGQKTIAKAFHKVIMGSKDFWNNAIFNGKIIGMGTRSALNFASYEAYSIAVNSLFNLGNDKKIDESDWVNKIVNTGLSGFVAGIFMDPMMSHAKDISKEQYLLGRVMQGEDGINKTIKDINRVADSKNGFASRIYGPDGEMITKDTPAKIQNKPPITDASGNVIHDGTINDLNDLYHYTALRDLMNYQSLYNAVKSGGMDETILSMYPDIVKRTTDLLKDQRYTQAELIKTEQDMTKPDADKKVLENKIKELKDHINDYGKRIDDLITPERIKDADGNERIGKLSKAIRLDLLDQVKRSGIGKDYNADFIAAIFEHQLKNNLDYIQSGEFNKPNEQFNNSIGNLTNLINTYEPKSGRGHSESYKLRFKQRQLQKIDDELTNMWGIVKQHGLTEDWHEKMKGIYNSLNDVIDNARKNEFYEEAGDIETKGVTGPNLDEHIANLKVAENPGDIKTAMNNLSQQIQKITGVGGVEFKPFRYDSDNNPQRYLAALSKFMFGDIKDVLNNLKDKTDVSDPESMKAISDNNGKLEFQVNVLIYNNKMYFMREKYPELFFGEEDNYTVTKDGKPGLYIDGDTSTKLYHEIEGIESDLKILSDKANKQEGDNINREPRVDKTQITHKIEMLTNFRNALTLDEGEGALYDTKLKLYNLWGNIIKDVTDVKTDNETLSKTNKTIIENESDAYRLIPDSQRVDILKDIITNMRRWHSNENYSYDMNSGISDSRFMYIDITTDGITRLYGPNEMSFKEFNDYAQVIDTRNNPNKTRIPMSVGYYIQRMHIDYINQIIGSDSREFAGWLGNTENLAEWTKDDLASVEQLNVLRQVFNYSKGNKFVAPIRDISDNSFAVNSKIEVRPIDDKTQMMNALFVNGDAGVGKTNILIPMTVKMGKDMGKNVILMAYDDKALEGIKDKIDMSIVTVKKHSQLGTFELKDNDLLIIDESSRFGTWKQAMMIRDMVNNSKGQVIFLGDNLQSVEPYTTDKQERISEIPFIQQISQRTNFINRKYRAEVTSISNDQDRMREDITKTPNDNKINSTQVFHFIGDKARAGVLYVKSKEDVLNEWRRDPDGILITMMKDNTLDLTEEERKRVKCIFGDDTETAQGQTFKNVYVYADLPQDMTISIGRNPNDISKMNLGWTNVDINNASYFWQYIKRNILTMSSRASKFMCRVGDTEFNHAVKSLDELQRFEKIPQRYAEGDSRNALYDNVKKEFDNRKDYVKSLYDSYKDEFKSVNPEKPVVSDKKVLSVADLVSEGKLSHTATDPTIDNNITVPAFIDENGNILDKDGNPMPEKREGTTLKEIMDKEEEGKKFYSTATFIGSDVFPCMMAVELFKEGDKPDMTTNQFFNKKFAADNMKALNKYLNATYSLKIKFHKQLDLYTRVTKQKQERYVKGTHYNVLAAYDGDKFVGVLPVPELSTDEANIDPKDKKYASVNKHEYSKADINDLEVNGFEGIEKSDRDKLITFNRRMIEMRIGKKDGEVVAKMILKKGYREYTGYGTIKKGTAKIRLDDFISSIKDKAEVLKDVYGKYTQLTQMTTEDGRVMILGSVKLKGTNGWVHFRVFHKPLLRELDSTIDTYIKDLADKNTFDDINKSKAWKMLSANRAFIKRDMRNFGEFVNIDSTTKRLILNGDDPATQKESLKGVLELLGKASGEEIYDSIPMEFTDKEKDKLVVDDKIYGNLFTYANDIHMPQVYGTIEDITVPEGGLDTILNIGDLAETIVSQGQGMSMDLPVHFGAIEEMQQYLSKIMPKIVDSPVFDTDLKVDGQNYWGYSNGMKMSLRLVNGQVAREAYRHEPIHILMNNFMSEAQRQMLYQNARQLMTEADMKVFGQTDDKTQEWMAQKFQDRDEWNKYKPEPKSILAKIWDSITNFFKGVRQFFSNIKDNSDDIYSFFSRVENGEYRDSMPVDNSFKSYGMEMDNNLALLVKAFGTSKNFSNAMNIMRQALKRSSKYNSTVDNIDSDLAKSFKNVKNSIDTHISDNKIDYSNKTSDDSSNYLLWRLSQVDVYDAMHDHLMPNLDEDGDLHDETVKTGDSYFGKSDPLKYGAVDDLFLKTIPHLEYSYDNGKLVSHESNVPIDTTKLKGWLINAAANVRSDNLDGDVFMSRWFENINREAYKGVPADNTNGVPTHGVKLEEKNNILLSFIKAFYNSDTLTIQKGSHIAYKEWIDRANEINRLYEDKETFNKKQDAAQHLLRSLLSHCNLTMNDTTMDYYDGYGRDDSKFSSIHYNESDTDKNYNTLVSLIAGRLYTGDGPKDWVNRIFGEKKITGSKWEVTPNVITYIDHNGDKIPILRKRGDNFSFIDVLDDYKDASTWEKNKGVESMRNYMNYFNNLFEFKMNRSQRKILADKLFSGDTEYFSKESFANLMGHMIFSIKAGMTEGAEQKIYDNAIKSYLSRTHSNADYNRASGIMNNIDTNEDKPYFYKYNPTSFTRPLRDLARFKSLNGIGNPTRARMPDGDYRYKFQNVSDVDFWFPGMDNKGNSEKFRTFVSEQLNNLGTVNNSPMVYHISKDDKVFTNPMMDLFGIDSMSDYLGMGAFSGRTMNRMTTADFVNGFFQRFWDSLDRDVIVKKLVVPGNLWGDGKTLKVYTLNFDREPIYSWNGKDKMSLNEEGLNKHITRFVYYYKRLQELSLDRWSKFLGVIMPRDDVRNMPIYSKGILDQYRVKLNNKLSTSGAKTDDEKRAVLNKGGLQENLDYRIKNGKVLWGNASELKDNDYNNKNITKWLDLLGKNDQNGLSMLRRQMMESRYDELTNVIKPLYDSGVLNLPDYVVNVPIFDKGHVFSQMIKIGTESYKTNNPYLELFMMTHHILSQSMEMAIEGNHLQFDNLHKKEKYAKQGGGYLATVGAPDTLPRNSVIITLGDIVADMPLAKAFGLDPSVKMTDGSTWRPLFAHLLYVNGLGGELSMLPYGDRVVKTFNRQIDPVTGMVHEEKKQIVVLSKHEIDNLGSFFKKDDKGYSGWFMKFLSGPNNGTYGIDLKQKFINFYEEHGDFDRANFQLAKYIADEQRDGSKDLSRHFVTDIVFDSAQKGDKRNINFMSLDDLSKPETVPLYNSRDNSREFLQIVPKVKDKISIANQLHNLISYIPGNTSDHVYAIRREINNRGIESILKDVKEKQFYGLMREYAANGFLKIRDASTIHDMLADPEISCSHPVVAQAVANTLASKFNESINPLVDGSRKAQTPSVLVEGYERNGHWYKLNELSPEEGMFTSGLHMTRLYDKDWNEVTEKKDLDKVTYVRPAQIIIPDYIYKKQFGLNPDDNINDVVTLNTRKDNINVIELAKKEMMGSGLNYWDKGQRHLWFDNAFRAYANVWVGSNLSGPGIPMGELNPILGRNGLKTASDIVDYYKAFTDTLLVPMVHNPTPSVSTGIASEIVAFGNRFIKPSLANGIDNSDFDFDEQNINYVHVTKGKKDLIPKIEYYSFRDDNIIDNAKRQSDAQLKNGSYEVVYKVLTDPDNIKFIFHQVSTKDTEALIEKAAAEEELIPNSLGRFFKTVESSQHDLIGIIANHMSNIARLYGLAKRPGFRELFKGITFSDPFEVQKTMTSFVQTVIDQFSKGLNDHLHINETSLGIIASMAASGKDVKEIYDFLGDHDIDSVISKIQLSKSINVKTADFLNNVSTRIKFLSDLAGEDHNTLKNKLSTNYTELIKQLKEQVKDEVWHRDKIADMVGSWATEDEWKDINSITGEEELSERGKKLNTIIEKYEKKKTDIDKVTAETIDTYNTKLGKLSDLKKYINISQILDNLQLSTGLYRGFEHGDYEMYDRLKNIAESVGTKTIHDFLYSKNPADDYMWWARYMQGANDSEQVLFDTQDSINTYANGILAQLRNRVKEIPGFDKIQFVTSGGTGFEQYFRDAFNKGKKITVILPENKSYIDDKGRYLRYGDDNLLNYNVEYDTKSKKPFDTVRNIIHKTNFTIYLDVAKQQSTYSEKKFLRINALDKNSNPVDKIISALNKQLEGEPEKVTVYLTGTTMRDLITRNSSEFENYVNMKREQREMCNLAEVIRNIPSTLENVRTLDTYHSLLGSANNNTQGILQHSPFTYKLIDDISDSLKRTRLNTPGQYYDVVNGIMKATIYDYIKGKNYSFTLHPIQGDKGKSIKVDLTDDVAMGDFIRLLPAHMANLDDQENPILQNLNNIEGRLEFLGTFEVDKTNVEFYRNKFKDLPDDIQTMLTVYNHLMFGFGNFIKGTLSDILPMDFQHDWSKFIDNRFMLLNTPMEGSDEITRQRQINNFRQYLTENILIKSGKNILENRNVADTRGQKPIMVIDREHQTRGFEGQYRRVPFTKMDINGEWVKVWNKDTGLLQIIPTDRSLVSTMEVVKPEDAEQVFRKTSGHYFSKRFMFAPTYEDGQNVRVGNNVYIARRENARTWTFEDTGKIIHEDGVNLVRQRADESMKILKQLIPWAKESNIPNQANALIKEGGGFIVNTAKIDLRNTAIKDLHSINTTLLRENPELYNEIRRVFQFSDTDAVGAFVGRQDHKPGTNAYEYAMKAQEYILSKYAERLGKGYENLTFDSSLKNNDIAQNEKNGVKIKC